jgi:hypothetical protein
VVTVERVEERKMGFHKVEAKELTGIWPEVYDPETKIKIEYTTRDMLKNPAQMHVMIRRNESLIFSFDVVESIAKHIDGRGFTATYTGSLDKVRDAFRKRRGELAEFISEDAFLSYLSAGAEVLFTKEQSVALFGAKIVFRYRPECGWNSVARSPVT